MSKVLAFPRPARRPSQGERLAASALTKAGATIIILPVVRIERHKALDCNGKTPPEGPSHRPKRKRA